MLSHIYRLVMDFETQHGYRPTLLYLNRQQYRSLQQQLNHLQGLETLGALLGLDIIINPQVTDPHLAAIKLRQLNAATA